MAQKKRSSIGSDLTFAYRAGVRYEWLFILYVTMIPLSVLGMCQDLRMIAFSTVCLSLITLFGLLTCSDGCVSLIRSARMLQLPDCRRTVFQAHALIVTCLLLLPCSMVLLLSGSWAAVSVITFCGVLGLLLPVILWRKKTTQGVALNALSVMAGIWIILAIFFYATRHPDNLVLFLMPLAATLLTISLYLWRKELTGMSQQYLLPSGSSSTTGVIALFTTSRAPTFSMRHFKRSPSDIVRMFLGEPYSPTSIGQRLVHVGFLLSILFVPPIILFAMNTQHTLADAALAWHSLWRPLLWLAGLLVWLVFHYAANGSGDLQRAQYDELALLPSIGNVDTQRHGLLWAILGFPMLTMLALLGVALLSAWSENATLSVYGQLGCFGIVVLSSFGSALIRGIAPSSINTCLTSTQRHTQNNLQGYLMPLLLSTSFRQIIFESDFTSAGATFANAFAIFFILSSALIVTFDFIRLRKLANLPHPFVEVTE